MDWGFSWAGTRLIPFHSDILPGEAFAPVILTKLSPPQTSSTIVNESNTDSREEMSPFSI